MANPNIVNVTSIYGNTFYLVPTTTTATAWTALTPAAGTINKIGSITATNVTATSVPGNSSLIVVDKSTGIYVGEAQSIVVTSGTTNSIEMVATYEAIT